MQNIEAPKGEKIWVKYCDAKGRAKFILTSKLSSRDYYYLYEIDEEAIKKIGRSKSPKNLEEDFGIYSKIKK